ncbi:MAG: vWA domain-containing protein [Candidatus Paceibacterota bacterium]
MRTTAAWATWRQTQYFGGFAIFALVILGWIYLAYFHQEPTCFDDRKNGTELGVDCGGDCVRICSFSVNEPTVRWSRSFKVTNGIYNAVAYVENQNREAASAEVEYVFNLYDEAGLITSREGVTILPPDGLYPIFEGRIETGRRTPTRTFIEIKPIEVWQPSAAGREQFTVVERSLASADNRPRLDAILRNNGLEEVREVEVVATIFDARGTALASSRTFVDNFAPRSDTQLFFTWPEPIATTLRSCEIPTDILLAIDVSGSMNEDQLNPPEPLTSVKEAAASFISRLGERDQVGVATFATGASVISPLSGNLAEAANTVGNIVIGEAEERGYTNTGQGLEAALEELNSLRHNENARKVLVLLTDGLATAPGTTEESEAFAFEVASTIKNSGVEIYSIGLGQNLNMDFVREVATSPNYAYQALSREDVDQIYQTITSSLCEQGAAVIDIVPKSTSGFVPLQ